MSDNWYEKSLTGQNPYQSSTIATTSATTSGGLGQLYPTTSGINLTGYPTTWPPVPTLPIKLNIRELVKLLRALESDEELKGIIQKFQPFIGVEV